MTKSLHGGVETLDGTEVEYYTGNFKGIFPLENSVGAPLSMDDQVSFVVTARVSDPSFKRDSKTGILVRKNTFEIEYVSALDPSKAQWLYDQLGKVVNGVNSLITVTQPVAEEQLDSEPSF